MKTETEGTKYFETQKKLFRAREMQKPGTERKPQGRKTIIHIDSDTTLKTIL